MKKIMFNNRYGLTESVLKRQKIQTRRIIPQSTMKRIHEFSQNYFDATFDMLKEVELLNQFFLVENIGRLPYQVGEVVAVAQSYKDIFEMFVATRDYKYNIPVKNVTEKAGWSNKMFVRADMMPHHVQFNGVRFERLQDISDEDCIKEGIDYVNGYSESYFFGFGVKTDKGWIKLGNTPREAYAALIDSISGKGTWESNLFVYAYDFGLVK